MPWQWGSTFLVPTSVIATTSQAGFPPDRVAVLDSHPLLNSWRSTTTVQHDIVLDFGALRTAVGFAVLNVNFTLLQLATSLDGINYSFFPGSPFIVDRDMDGFYKFYIALERTFRWLLVRIPAQTPIFGHPYYEVGAVLCPASMAEFPVNPEPDMVETVSRPYLRSGPDIAPIGAQRVTLNFQRMVPVAQQSQFRQLANLGQHTPLLVFRNAGIPAQVCLFRNRDDIQVRVGGNTITVNPTWEEMV